MGDATNILPQGVESRSPLQYKPEDFPQEKKATEPSFWEKGHSTESTLTSASYDERSKSDDFLEKFDTSRSFSVDASEPKQIEQAHEDDTSIGVTEQLGNAIYSAGDALYNAASYCWGQLFGTHSKEDADKQLEELEAEMLKLAESDPTNPFYSKMSGLSRQDKIGLENFLHKLSLLIDLLEEDFSDSDFERIMEAILYNAQMSTHRLNDEAQKINVEKMIKDYNRQKAATEQKKMQAEKMLEDLRKDKWWGRFDKIMSAVFGVGTGIGLAATSASGWGVVALCYALGNAVNNNYSFVSSFGTATNNQSDNPFEALMAKGIVRFGKEFFGWKDGTKTHRDCFNKLKWGFGIVSAVMSFGLGFNALGGGLDGFRKILGVLTPMNIFGQGVSGWKKANLSYEKNHRQAELMGTDESLRRASEGINTGTKFYGRKQERDHAQWLSALRNEESKSRAIRDQFN